MSFYTEWTPELQQALLAPLDGGESFLPRRGREDAKGTARKCVGLIYADAAAVLARLNEAVGPGWTFETELLGTDPAIVLRGKLTILDVTREDFGEAAKEQEPFKSAWSDALKRCARTFGIGLYLWSVGECWGEHDGWKWTRLPVVTPEAREHALRLAGYKGTILRVPQPESYGDARVVQPRQEPALQTEATPEALRRSELMEKCLEFVPPETRRDKEHVRKVMEFAYGKALPAKWSEVTETMWEQILENLETPDPFASEDAGAVA